MHWLLWVMVYLALVATGDGVSSVGCYGWCTMRWSLWVTVYHALVAIGDDVSCTGCYW